MATLCMNPARDRHEIADGGRKVTFTTVVQWGADDLRDDWQGDYVFCSFGCCGEWVAAKALQHDGRFVREGVEATV